MGYGSPLFWGVGPFLSCQIYMCQVNHRIYLCMFSCFSFDVCRVCVDFLVFVSDIVTTVNPPLDSALTVSPNFWYVVFSMFILTLWTTGCSGMLLSFQVFIDFPVFSLSHWFLGVSILYFLWFLLFYFLRFVCGPGHSLSWCMFCEPLKHMCILLLGGVFCKCWWNLISSWCFWVLYPCWFSD